MSTAGRFWKFLPAALLLACGLLLRLEYLREYAAFPLFSGVFGADVAEYHAWALRIFSGELLPRELPIHAPLYAYFLSGVYAVFGVSAPAARAVQLLLNYLALASVYFLLKRRESRAERSTRFLPEFFLAFAMFYVPLFFHQAELVSESLLLVLLAPALWCFKLADEVQGRRRLSFLSGAGFFCGLAVITHPMTLGFAGLEFLFLAYRAVRRREFAPCAVCAAAFLAVLLPVCLYNSALARRPVLVQGNSAFNFYLGNNPDADGECYLRPGRAWQDFHREVRREAEREKVSEDALLLRRTARFYWEKPWMAPYLAGLKAAKFFSPHELVAGADQEELVHATWIQRAARFFAAAFLPLALLGLLCLLISPGARAANRHFLLLFGGFFFMQVLTVTSGRYRSAAFLVLFLFAAFAVSWLLSAAKRERLVMAAILILLWWVMFFDCARPEEKLRQSRRESAILRGLAWMGGKNWQSALAELKRARAIDGDPILHAVDFGKCHEELGDFAAAAAEYRASIRANGLDKVDCLVNLGNLYARAGRLDEAGKCYAAAVRDANANSNAWYNYGIHLAEQKRPSDAAAAFEAALKLEPGHAGSLNSLGVLALQSGDAAAAAGFFEAAVRREPHDERYLRNFAYALKLSGRLEDFRRVQARLSGSASERNAGGGR